MSKPREPTKEEWDSHMITHIPFRNWCPFCVKGRGRQDSHKVGKEECGIAAVMLDYCTVNEESKEDERPILVSKDKKSGKMIAMVVPRKGDHPKAIQMYAREIRRLGHGSMVIKSDQEPSIVSFKEKVRKELGSGYEIKMEESPAYSHQSNGEMEQMVGHLKGIVRTLWYRLESKYGRKIREGEDLFPWMVQHAADLHNRANVGEDGKTPFERMRGKKFRKEMVEIGEGVMAMIQSEEKKRDLRDNWIEGVWLGVREESMESIIGTAQGVIKVRT